MCSQAGKCSILTGKYSEEQLGIRDSTEGKTGESAHGGREERQGIETEGGWGREDGREGRGRRKGRQNLWVCKYFTFTMCVTEGERKTTAQLVSIPELARSGTKT